MDVVGPGRDAQIVSLVDEGVAEVRNGHLRLTERGFPRADGIALTL